MKSARGQPHYLPDLQPAIPWFRGFTQSPPVFLRKINFYLAFNLLYQLPGTVLCEDEGRSCPRKLAAFGGRPFFIRGFFISFCLALSPNHLFFRLGCVGQAALPILFAC
jgi:hypothetical protein